MRDNEGIYQVIDAIVYYSNTNQSKRIAQYFADKLGYRVWDIYDVPYRDFDNLVLSFPIHCQSLPDIVKQFLAKSQIKNLTLLATYGRMCHGNALYEAQKKYSHTVVAGAYIPTRHTYLQDKEFDALDSLAPIVEKVLAPSPIKIPKSYKNPLSDLLKRRRSQLGVKIIKTDACNACGKCANVCKENAITNGVTNNKCIRCLKCLTTCPSGALEYALSAPMRAYLKKKKRDELIIYI
ncbi:MAG: 4Fe-4S binding protein [Clostridia bacterium]|nr:4Fe-4S binding protein [Clostridia bacterium]